MASRNGIGGRTRFLGRPLDPLTMGETVERCADWIAEGGRARVVMTVNAATLVAMRSDPGLAQACEDADLVVADGVPVVWAARLAGRRVPERVAGIDLMSRLLREADRRGWKVYLLGARPATVARLAERLRRRLPGLAIVGARDGYFDPSEADAIAAEVATSGAELLFIGMPTPAKELWAWRQRDAVGPAVIVGVGGSFDVLTGHVRRAPRTVQRLGLEWAWRLAMEPRRLWRRYLVKNSQFIAAAGREIVASRLRRR
jgi:N-acetylglucosaminyldiphosphoundecaprenol N-acetyl-beta-D-mannosaminyltransferase